MKKLILLGLALLMASSCSLDWHFGYRTYEEFSRVLISGNTENVELIEQSIESEFSDVKVDLEELNINYDYVVVFDNSYPLGIYANYIHIDTSQFDNSYEISDYIIGEMLY